MNYIPELDKKVKIREGIKNTSAPYIALDFEKNDILYKAKYALGTNYLPIFSVCAYHDKCHILNNIFVSKQNLEFYEEGINKINFLKHLTEFFAFLNKENDLFIVSPIISSEGQLKVPPHIITDLDNITNGTNNHRLINAKVTQFYIERTRIFGVMYKDEHYITNVVFADNNKILMHYVGDIHFKEKDFEHLISKFVENYKF